MNVVTVSREELLSRLKTNKENHTRLYKEAVAGWRQLVVTEMQKNLLSAKDGDDVKLNINLQPPQDHTEDYDNIIAMVEMSVDQTIQLESHDFQAYVLDKWQWAKQAALLNSTYAASAQF